jgi:hypothetical protein
MFTDDRTIFTVTTVHYHGAGYGVSPRTVGWFSTLAEAQDCVRENRGDIYEGVYTYAVIEELPAGLYPIPIGQDWFAWSGEGYQPSDAPPQGDYAYPFMSGNYALQARIG